MKATIFSFSAVAALILASCSSTVYDRIEENQSVFNALPESEKVSVSKGEITKGMSPEGVKIAWGEPDATATGVIEGKSSERWLYSDGGGSGWSVGVGAGVGRARSTGFGLGTGVSIPIGYIPPNYSYVLFKDGKVDEWIGKGK